MADPELVDYDGCFAFVTRAQCSQSDIGPTIGQCFGKISQANPEVDLTDAPRVYYLQWEGGHFEIEAAFPVAEGSQPQGDGIEVKSYPAGTAVMVSYLGPYEGIPGVWSSVMEYAQAQGFDFAPPGWESYVTDPSSEPDPSKWQTDIFVPVNIRKV